VFPLFSSPVSVHFHLTNPSDRRQIVVIIQSRRVVSVVPVFIAMIVFVLDQLSKAMMVDILGSAAPREHIPVLGSWLRFDLVTNSGAAFGLFQDRTMLFTAVAIVAVPALILFHNSLPSQSWLARNCVGLLIGGTLGNLIDRVRYGYVVDFIDAGIGNMRWPTFNIADSAFVIGVLILCYYFLTSAEKSNTGGQS
jgi:signal peptidase II